MSNTLIVPARLEKAAKELVNNMTILKGCSPEVKEVIAMAAKQNCLTCYHKGDGIKGDGGYVIGNDLAIAYCLPDDIEIAVVDEKSAVPEWVRKKYTVCEVVNSGTKSYRISFPDNGDDILVGLPAALRCDGWIFKGWLHKGYNYVDNCPLMFNTGRDFWRSISESRDLDGCITSTAYASVWQKAGK